ncbi:hypothetical protein QBC39DRAFT_331301 [Podospora conica]|nr:hypothetical protein QBC39DRAFT_331301 [Schizothecium conicum]
MMFQTLGRAIALIAISTLGVSPVAKGSELPPIDIVTKTAPGPEVKFGQFFAYEYGFCRLSAGWEVYEPKKETGCVAVKNKQSLGYMRGGGDYNCEISTWSGIDCKGKSKPWKPVDEDITCFAKTPYASFHWNCTAY